MAQHNTLGSWGEKMAAEYLLRQGYAIREQNYKVANLEVDIIASKDDRIAFVEVKTRGCDVIDPTDAVDMRKIRRIAAAADSYMQYCPDPLEPQIDIITVIVHPDQSYTIDHFEDAVIPPLKAY